VPYIPEGQWLCRKCTVSPENPVSCVMCPSEGGAFKQTTTGKWAHLLCAIWIPEAGVGNTVYMEPIDGVEMITKQRWKLVRRSCPGPFLFSARPFDPLPIPLSQKCSLCKKPGGACIQCENKSCYTALHPTCAREAGLLGSMKTYGDTGGVLKAYCERHIPVRPPPYCCLRRPHDCS
jgi:NuA3 HAT complex component NTO1